MVTATKLVLSASVTVKDTGKAKCPQMSFVVIRYGDIIVAANQLDGYYSETQALKEFRKNGGNWKKHAGWETYATAKAAGVV